MDEAERLEKMVDDFAARMLEKLIDKDDEGWSGWSQPNYRKVLEHKLMDHAVRALQGESEQWLDVANFAAFLDYQSRQEDTESSDDQ